MTRTWLYIALMFACTTIFSGRLIANDTAVLTPDLFIRQILQFHPVARQAGLITQQAAASLLSARGGFDPGFQLNTENKSLDGTTYYQYANSQLKVATPLGVGVKMGVEHASGQYRNPEYTEGIASYVGVELPLLNGLLLDKRRAVLQQAKIFADQSEQDRQAMINDLLYDAYLSYWEWAKAHQLYSVFTNYVNIGERRMRLIRIAYNNGDKAVADTVETFAQLQSYRLLQSNALLALQTKSLDLSQFLWSSTGEPYQLAAGSGPDVSAFQTPTTLPDTTGITDQLVSNHPLLRSTAYKVQGLMVERKLKFQNLLPQFNIQANLLSKDYFDYKSLSRFYLENNYKLGMAFRMPIPFRQARGEYNSVRIKIKDLHLELDNKKWQLQTKLRQYYNEAVQLRKQIETAEEMYRSYNTLLKIEEMKFSQGESSLFLVNSRENKTLEMEEKLLELKTKYLKTVYAIRWVTGTGFADISP